MVEEEWLPIPDTKRTTAFRLAHRREWSYAELGLERIAKRAARRAARLERGYPNPIPRARAYAAALDESANASYATVAARFGVTRAEVCQYVTILRRLPPHLVYVVENEQDPLRLCRMSLRRLLAIARLPSKRSRAAAFQRLLA